MFIHFFFKKNTGVDECVAIILKYSNQRMASISISGTGARMSNTTIVGDLGVLKVFYKNNKFNFDFF